ncbi:MAG: 2-oxoacid:acceptor oxidoreductase subunit alpha [Candidatus Helarchaeota archaeon]|nr:2-oxoacid:acceptor oxidoreductase subunit alpha [Candidatus Helarchaeota archaeon]
MSRYKDYDGKPGKTVLMGNSAMAEGCIAGGCRFFAGYPITPQNEVPEYMSRRLPQVGGRFIQMEDEIGSIAAVVGAAITGIKAMTSTSGPGFSLMQEIFSWAACIELPLVICDVQRTGPGSGIVSLPHHSDIMQAHWGGNGEYQIIAYAPATCQELYDFAIEAFNDSEQYRTPVVVFSDSWLGHIYEKVIIPTKEELKQKVISRKKFTGDPNTYKGASWKDKEGNIVIPDPPILGENFFPGWLPSVTHTPMYFPSEAADVSYKMIEAINQKILDNEEKIVKVQKFNLDDADIAVICYGLPFRTVKTAMKMARAEGLKVGILRLITPWPFAKKEVKKLSEGVKKIVMVEMNWGQLLTYAEAAVEDGTEVHFVPEISTIPEPKKILNKIKEVA